MAFLTYKSMPKQCEGQGMKTQRVDRKEDGNSSWKRRAGERAQQGHNNRLDAVPGLLKTLAQVSARTSFVLLEDRPSPGT